MYIYLREPAVLASNRVQVVVVEMVMGPIPNSLRGISLLENEDRTNLKSS